MLFLFQSVRLALSIHRPSSIELYLIYVDALARCNSS